MKRSPATIRRNTPPPATFRQTVSEGEFVLVEGVDRGPPHRALYVARFQCGGRWRRRAPWTCDVVILDLEDAVAAEDKARRAPRGAMLKTFGAREVVVRVNAAATQWHDEDMAELAQARPDAILLPKISGPADIEAAKAKSGGVPLWAMIETPRSVFNAAGIARSGADCLILGVNDLISAMIGRHRPTAPTCMPRMALTVLAARAAGITALDGVHNELDDMTGFAAACAQSRDFGFDGKSVIHPSQIAPAKAAFSPSLEEIANARRMLAAFAAQPGAGW